MAKGGIGGIITGFTSVASNDKYIEGQMRLSEDKLIPQYKKLTDIVHKENCPIIAQIALGAYYKGSNEVEIDDMTEEEIKMLLIYLLRLQKEQKKQIMMVFRYMPLIFSF